MESKSGKKQIKVLNEVIDHERDSDWSDDEEEESRQQELHQEKAAVESAETQEKQYKDLFGDDISDDEDEEANDNNDKDTRIGESVVVDGGDSRMKDLFGSDDDDDDEEEGDNDTRAEEEEEQDIEETVNLPSMEALEDAPDNIFITHMPNFLSVQPKEFDSKLYDAEQELNEKIVDSDDPAEQRLRQNIENVIRWRLAPADAPEEACFTDPRSGIKMESNARIIRWDDGTYSLSIGSEIFDCPVKDVSKENRFLCGRWSTTVSRYRAQLKHSMAFRPTSTRSAAHKSLTAKVLARHKKQSKTIVLGNLEDPDGLRKKMEKEYNESIKMERKMKAKRNRNRELTAEMLEEDLDEEENALRNRSAARKGDIFDEEDDYDNDFVVDDDHVEYDEDQDELDRLADIQKGAPDDDDDEMDMDDHPGSKSGPGEKRRRMVLDDDDD